MNDDDKTRAGRIEAAAKRMLEGVGGRTWEEYTGELRAALDDPAAESTPEVDADYCLKCQGRRKAKDGRWRCPQCDAVSELDAACRGPFECIGCPVCVHLPAPHGALAAVREVLRHMSAVVDSSEDTTPAGRLIVEAWRDKLEAALDEAAEEVVPVKCAHPRVDSRVGGHILGTIPKPGDRCVCMDCGENLRFTATMDVEPVLAGSSPVRVPK